MTDSKIILNNDKEVYVNRWNYTNRRFVRHPTGAWVHYRDVALIVEEKADQIANLQARIQYLENKVNHQP